MFKNVASQKVRVFAFDSTTNLPKSGDGANITAYVSKDSGAVTVLTDTSATEEDATNAKGFYLFDVSQTETNADTLAFSAKSSTANIVVIAVPAVVYTRPVNFSATSIDSNGRVDVIKVAGTTQTAGDIIGDTNDSQSRLPAALVSGRMDASVGAMANNVMTAASLAADAGAEIADAVWDEALSGHQTVGTTGRAMTLAGVILSETTASGVPTTTTLPLTAGSAVNDFYNDLEIIPTSGALAGQARIITDYDGATKTITVDEPWTSALTAGDTVLIRATHKHTILQIQSGLATSASIAALNNLSAAQVNSEVLDVLTTDTHAELSAVPAATTTILKMLQWVFMLSRNKTTQTNTTKAIRDDGDTVNVATAAVSDDGTTFAREKFI